MKESSETAPRLPDVEVARILSSLATLLADRGRLGEADRLASRAGKLYEKTRGPDRERARRPAGHALPGIHGAAGARAVTVG